MSYLSDFAASPKAVPIPLVLVLWEHPDFGGIKRVFCRCPKLVNDNGEILVGGGGCANLSQCEFTDKGSSVGVHPGPDFGDGKVRWLVDRKGQLTFLPHMLIRDWRSYYVGPDIAGLRTIRPTFSMFENPNFLGEAITLGPGAYPRLENYGFNDRITSILPNFWRQVEPGYGSADSFHPIDVAQDAEGGVGLPGPAATIGSIPLVLELSVPDGYLIDLVESSADLKSEYGSRFNNTSGAVLRADQGPNYSGAEVGVAWSDRDWQGVTRVVFAGGASTLRDTTSSISIQNVPAVRISQLTQPLTEEAEREVLTLVRGAINASKLAQRLGVGTDEAEILSRIFVQGGLETLRDCLTRRDPEYWHTIHTAIQALKEVLPRRPMIEVATSKQKELKVRDTIQDPA